ncbi:MAG: glycosyltransferase [Nanoarchaeota archaeon]|nr:glycosyltransferase [Nanoarchaeota archaeon]
MIKFSLIIPVAPDRNAEIIESISHIDYPKSKFQVIVVKGKNPSENRNKGAAQAKGEFLAFLDDDAVIDKDILKNAENFFGNNKNIDIVGGPQLTPKDEKGFALKSGYALSSKFGAWKMANRYSGTKEVYDVDETMLTSANLFCKKRVFDKIKFDPNLFPGEDPKFIEDAKKEGYKVAYSPNLIVYHRRRATLKGLIKQIFNYGKTRPKKESLINTIKKPFFVIPSLFVLYLVGLMILSFISYSYIWFIPLGLYLLMDFLFSIYESVKNNSFYSIFYLIFIFPIIHISYGLGMILGSLTKLKPKKNTNTQ